MNVRNCRNCGRIFNYVTGIMICPGCRESMEAKFQEVKEYVRAHKGAAIPEVAEACDVEQAQIRQWLREERLEVTEDSALFLSCEVCGSPMRSGRFCDKCKNSMTKNFNQVVNASKPTPVQEKKTEDGGPKMRYLQ